MQQKNNQTFYLTKFQTILHLTILSTVFSSFSNKHIKFAAENVKSSLVNKVKPTEHKKPRWSNDMKSLTFKENLLWQENQIKFRSIYVHHQTWLTLFVYCVTTVSYTHLDVYKRQILRGKSFIVH